MDMKNLLKPHQILLMAALFLAGVQIAVYFLLLKPQSDTVQEITENIDELRSSMKSGKWPWDNVLLEKHLKELRKEAGGDAKGGGKRPDRLERARKMMGGTFSANIQIICYDHNSLLGEITNYIEDMGIPLTALAVKINKNKTCSITTTLQVKSREQLDSALMKLHKRSDVIEAYRSVN